MIGCDQSMYLVRLVASELSSVIVRRLPHCKYIASNLVARPRSLSTYMYLMCINLLVQCHVVQRYFVNKINGCSVNSLQQNQRLISARWGTKHCTVHWSLVMPENSNTCIFHTSEKRVAAGKSVVLRAEAELEAHLWTSDSGNHTAESLKTWRQSAASPKNYSDQPLYSLLLVVTVQH